jgi:hypothetical protein
VVRFGFVFACLSHDPALPDYENHDKKEANDRDRVSEPRGGRGTGQRDGALPVVHPALRAAVEHGIGFGHVCRSAADLARF